MEQMNKKYFKTKLGYVFAKCSHFEFRLNGQNRITDCNCHSPKGVLSLTEMYSMAYLIDPSEEKIEGFISKNPKLMKKTNDLPKSVKVWARKKGLP